MRNLLLALSFLALAAAPAVAEMPAAGEPTAEQVKAYLQHRSDPVVGAWVERQLHEDHAAATSPVAPDGAGETAQDAMAGFLDARLAVIKDHIGELATA